jgi:hypothetical protein
LRTGQRISGHDDARGQLLKLLPTAALLSCQSAQALVNMLCVDYLL